MNESDSVWGDRRAGWYSAGLQHSDYADKVVDVIGPIIKDCASLLDVGAGCGALCIPLARKLEHVTALDSSSAMLDELRREAVSSGISNIRTELAAWNDAEQGLDGFDVVIVANVPGVLDDPDKNIPRLERHARKFIFLVLGTPINSNKFFFRELWPLIYGVEFPAKRDYFDMYGVLYRMGIFANVTVVNYDFDQPFRDIDEAVAFWKDHMRLVGEEHDGRLRQFLSDRLDRSGETLWARVPKQSAILWWSPSRK